MIRLVLGASSMLVCMSLSSPLVPGDDDVTMRDLSSSSKEARKRAEKSLVEQRERLIEELLRLAKDSVQIPEKLDTTVIAMRLLGKMRAIEAIPFLVEQFQFSGRRHVMLSRLPSFEELAPAASALVQIGSPLAVQPLLKKAEETDEIGRMRTVATVLERILRADLAVAAVDQRLSKVKDQKSRKRLETLRERIDTADRFTKE